MSVLSTFPCWNIFTVSGSGGGGGSPRKKEKKERKSKDKIPYAFTAVAGVAPFGMDLFELRKKTWEELVNPQATESFPFSLGICLTLVDKSSGREA